MTDKIKGRVSSLILATVLLTIVSILRPVVANAATFTGIRESITDPRPSATSVAYTTTVNNATTGTNIKCIKIYFSTGAGTTVVPTGMVTTSASLDTSATSNFLASWTSWTVDTATNGQIGITLAAGANPATATNAAIRLTGITNGSVAATSYFVQMYTYTDVSCTTLQDSGVGAFIYNDGQTASVTVDPSLSFTIGSLAAGTTANTNINSVTTTSTTIPFGNLSVGQTASGGQTLVAATNATSGYTVYIKYAAPLTSGGGATIPAYADPNNLPTNWTTGASGSFGYTTNDATLAAPGTATRFTSGGPNWAGFVTSSTGPGDIVADNTTFGTFNATIGYKVGVTANNAAGTYTSVVLLTIVPQY